MKRQQDSGSHDWIRCAALAAVLSLPTSPATATILGAALDHRDGGASSLTVEHGAGGFDVSVWSVSSPPRDADVFVWSTQEGFAFTSVFRPGIVRHYAWCPVRGGRGGAEAPIPEPHAAEVFLVGLGLVALGVNRRAPRRSRRTRAAS